MINVICQIVVLLINLIIAFSHKTDKFLKLVFISNIFTMLSYICRGNYIGTLIYSVVLIRSMLYVYKEKFGNWLCYTMVVTQLIFGLFSISSPIEIFNSIAGVWSCIYMWFYTAPIKIKFGNILNAILRLVYDLYSGLWILVFVRIFNIVMNCIGIMKDLIIYKTELINKEN